MAGFFMAQAGMTCCFFLDGLNFIAVIAGLLLMRPPKFLPRQNLTEPVYAFGLRWAAAAVSAGPRDSSGD
jgi:hypothetical protein